MDGQKAGVVKIANVPGEVGGSSSQVAGPIGSRTTDTRRTLLKVGTLRLSCYGGVCLVACMDAAYNICLHMCMASAGFGQVISMFVGVCMGE